MEGLLWVALGSVLGGSARFWLSGFVGRWAGETFPWGTMAVNVSGCLAIGLLAASAAVGHSASVGNPWLFAATGMLGCYTTVSSFSLQTMALARGGNLPQAAANVVLSLTLCLAAAWAGYAGGLEMFGSRPQ